MSNEETKRNVAVVTGSSSGIGFETSLILSRNGFCTYATMRNLNKSQQLKQIAKKEDLPLKVLQLDVTDDKSVKDAFNQIKNESGRIDVLVNNAGYDIMGSVEDLTIDEFKEQFDTNFFGAIRVTKEVIPIMRNQKSGTIINLSSILGRIAMPLNGAYISSKFALEGLSETMRYELQEYGINVILIEPGIVKGFLKNLKMAENAIHPSSPYLELMQKSYEDLRPTLEKISLSPLQVAEIILEAIVSKSPEVRYLVGSEAIFFIEQRQRLSDKEFEKWMKQNLTKK